MVSRFSIMNRLMDLSTIWMSKDGLRKACISLKFDLTARNMINNTCGSKLMQKKVSSHISLYNLDYNRPL